VIRKTQHSISDVFTAANSWPWFPAFSLLLAATLWGIFWFPLRILAEYGLTGLWSSFFIYLGTTLVAVKMLWGRLGELTQAPLALFVIALASGWCNTAFILAMLDGNVVRVLLLFYLSPVWTVILGHFFLNEQFHPRSFVVMGLAMMGAVIMLWHADIGLPIPQSEPDWLALSSGMAFAVINVSVRKTQQVSVGVKTSIALLGAVLVSALLIMLTASPLGQPGWMTIVSALVFGMVVMALMTLSVQYGVTHMPVHRSAVILLFEVVVGAISAMILTDEVMTAREWLGGALVMVAAYLSAFIPNEAIVVQKQG